MKMLLKVIALVGLFVGLLREPREISGSVVRAGMSVGARVPVELTCAGHSSGRVLTDGDGFYRVKVDGARGPCTLTVKYGSETVSVGLAISSRRTRYDLVLERANGSSTTQGVSAAGSLPVRYMARASG